MNRPPNQPPSPIKIGADGTISADGERLFYCPLAGRRLYSVSVDALINEQMLKNQAATVVDHGERWCFLMGWSLILRTEFI